MVMFRLLSTALVLLIMQGCYYTTIDNEKCFVAPQSVHCPVSSDIENVIRKNPNKSINQVRSDIKYCANMYFSNIRELNIPQDFDNYIFMLKEKGIPRNDKELAYNAVRNMHIICLSSLDGYDYYQKTAEFQKIDYKKEMEKLLNENH
ncbi:hypothetical protein [Neisseria meningitidis]|uniref:hypothetical protein n=1 Tax=Neisseria meningitidis TaxID=487 RepID=UPI0007666170|nr:hypothetical protein [Neisseria meningitidis]CWO93755.1 Uncharacterised protein [Neisseria meningitidis]CWS86451.1 Uncharacterised protein [Neisseria meningitidis]